MFHESINRLTTAQKRALHAAGISRFLIGDWKAGRRLPTEPQVVIYAGLVGIDRHELQDEIALLRATEEQRPLLEQYVGKLAAGVLVMLSFGYSGPVPPAANHGEQTRPGATMYIRSTLRAWLRLNALTGRSVNCSQSAALPA